MMDLEALLQYKHKELRELDQGEGKNSKWMQLQKGLEEDMKDIEARLESLEMHRED